MKKYLHYTLIPLFAAIGAIIFINLFANVDINLQALQARMSVKTSLHGLTVLEVNPLGKVKAKTHKTPLSINISLENLDMEHLTALLAEGAEQEEVVQEAKIELIRAVRKFVILSLILSFAGGMFGVVVLQKRSLKELLLGGLIGLALVSSLLLGTYRTFDVQKFQYPEYYGVLKAAPWMIGLAEEAFNTVNTWGRQMRGIAKNVNGLFQRVESLENISPGEGEIKVLHVSDIHNNPASLEFIDQVVKTFGIDVIIDTGDLSDFGTPLEAELFEGIKRIGVPYVVVPGNHETPDILSKLDLISNVIIIKKSSENITGLNISGIADPASESPDFTSPSETEITKRAAQLEEMLDSGKKTPDIIAVHNPKIAEKFYGKAPVILSGHDHRFGIKVRNGSVFIDAGTSGAAGIGSFRTNKEIPYTFVLLHFDRTPDGTRLKYTDTIKISNRQSGYSLERKVYPAKNRLTDSDN